MILLWGLAEDEPLELVRRALQLRGVPFVAMHEADLERTHLELEYSPAARGVLKVNGARHSVESIRAMYLRPFELRALPAYADLDLADPRLQRVATLHTLLWSLAEVAAGTVLTRPSAMLSNGSKPLQSRWIAEQGFEVPELLVTTEAGAAWSFRARHGEVIYKSISGTRSIIQRLTDEHRSRMSDLRWCPTLFQRWIEGVDYRVHVVGSRLFATRVLSEAVDYRYGPATLEAFDLPADVAQRCLRVARAFDLSLAGIDLRLTPDGRWYCFEVNPTPAYSGFERITGQPISVEVANLLAGVEC